MTIARRSKITAAATDKAMSHPNMINQMCILVDKNDHAHARALVTEIKAILGAHPGLQNEPGKVNLLGRGGNTQPEKAIDLPGASMLEVAMPTRNNRPPLSVLQLPPSVIQIPPSALQIHPIALQICYACLQLPE